MPPAWNWAEAGGRAAIEAAAGVLLVKDVRIPVRDGTRLAADLYVPSERSAPETRASRGGELPVVMDYLPYRKDEVAPGYARMYHEIARHGYVVARVDIRGTGGSDGVAVDEYVAQEQLDGYDCVEWLGTQPWSDGHVNMIGISYGGFTCLQVAAEQPPHLTSIVPMDFTDDRYTDDCHYRGGCLRMYYDVGWYGTRMIAWNAMPPDPAVDGDWARLWQERLARNEPYLLEWLRHQTDGPYWRQGSIRGHIDRIRCPAFLIGGWNDGYPNPPLRVYRELAVPAQVWIGPCNHVLPDAAIPGPRVYFLREVIRWLDRWCREDQGGHEYEPPVVVYMQTAQQPVPDRLDAPGAWRAEQAWPAPGAHDRTLFLGPNGMLVDDEVRSAGDGVDTFEYRPTVGTSAGLWSGGVPFGVSTDQRIDEAHSLVYTSALLADALPVLGWPHVSLSVSSSATVVAFVASLSDVAPDGTSQLVAKGMLNATRRESLTGPKPLTPGELVDIEIEIDATGWLFQRGHRVRLSIASADWPNVWPTGQPATNHVHRGPGRPSRLVLPEVPPEGSASPPSFEPSTVEVSPPSAAVPGSTWILSNDQLTGRARMTMSVASAFVSPEGTPIEREFGCVCEVDPHDPARATARGWHVCRSGRAGSTIESRADVSIGSTATHFHVSIDLHVKVNGVAHFSRSWTESIRRVLL